MIIVCSFCEKFIGLKEGHGVSHGCCKECFKKQMEKIKEMDKEEK